MAPRALTIATLCAGAFSVSCLAQTVDLTGTITNGSNGLPCKNVRVSLKSCKEITTVSAQNGTYRLTGTSALPSQPSHKNIITESHLSGNILEFSSTGSDPVTIDLFSVAGAKIKTLFKGATYAQGRYSFNLAHDNLAANLYFVNLRQGSVSSINRYVPMNSTLLRPSMARQFSSAPLSKKSAYAIDTILFSSCNFSIAKVGVTSYSGRYDAVVQPLSPPSIAMATIPGGTFTMGSDSILDIGAAPPHQVTLSPFSISATEITQALFARVMGSNPSHFLGNDSLPVENVTWFDAILFCNALSNQLGKDSVYTYTVMTVDSAMTLTDITINYTKHGFRLPTEAEWEYACRAGTSTVFYWGDTMDGSYCWYYNNSGLASHQVAT
jgi:hypothetical protein